MTDRVEVHQLRRGEPGGPDVVLVHGLEDTWSSWRPLARLLDGRWRVTALDLPWRAGNDYRWRAGDSPAGWLAAGLDALGGPVDAVVAHSFGANATLELMAARDHRIRGAAAVLVCPLYRPPAVRVTWEVFDRARATFERHIRDGVRARLGTRATILEQDVLKGMGDKAIDRIGPRGLLAAFDCFVTSTDLRLDAVAQRALVLAGGADRSLPAAAARALAARIADAAVEVAEGFDHFCHVRRPKLVADHVRRFLRVAAAVDERGPATVEGAAR